MFATEYIVRVGGGKTNDFANGGPGGHTADLTTTNGAFQQQIAVIL